MQRRAVGCIPDLNPSPMSRNRDRDNLGAPIAQECLELERRDIEPALAEYEGVSHGAEGRKTALARKSSTDNRRRAV